MAFTQAQLQAQFTFPALITRFEPAGASATAIYIQNVIDTAQKTGWCTCAQSLTAAQSAAAIKTALNRV